jgi:F5/8 type C domain-containing protein
MLNPAARRLTLLVLSLAAAALACARAEVDITPAAPLVVSPVVVAQVPTSTSTVEAASPTPEAPTATVETTPTSEIPATEAPTATPVIAPPPTDTPLPATDTPVPTATPIPSDTPISTGTLPPPPTETQPGPAATPTPLQPIGTNPAGIPENAKFTQQFNVSNQGGTVFGRPQDMRDGRTETWASLRGGDAMWIFDLGSPQNVIGLRVWPQPDAGQQTTLRSIEVSADGTNWTPVYVGEGACGDVPQCDVLAQKQFVDFGFGPVTVQFVRMHGGPTYFAFAEVKIALAP